MTNSSTNIINGNRSVAYFDVLGFKNKVCTKDINQISKQYEKLIKLTDGYAYLDPITHTIMRKHSCYRYIFSDSIFLIAYDDSEKSFIDLFSYAWRMMQIALASGYWLRGAITYGEVYVNLDSNIYIGKSIVDAVTLEGKQNWMGAVVDDSAIKRYSSIFNESYPFGGLYKLLLPIHDVPFKDGTRPEMNVINWRLNIISEAGIKKLFNNDSQNEAIQKKIENTLAFSKEIVNSGYAYLDDSIVPERYRRFFIVKTLPKLPNAHEMFCNGDEY